jgi:Mg-chelatase subunit ChlD
MGTLTGGKFSMIVSFQYDLDASTLDEWRVSWQRASELLYSASDGAHQYGRIYFALDSFGSRNADWWIDPVNAQAHVDGNRIWAEGHGTLGFDEKDFPFIIVHEFGHYGYDCGDEYQGDGCTAEVASCIMESEKNQGDRFEAGAFVEGDVVEWCVEANHDPNGDTKQDDYDYGGETGHSCWYAINFHWGAAMPSAIPDGTRTTGADPVDIVVLEKQTRIALVLDRSGSMSGAAITEAQIGADSFIDLTNHDGDTYQDHFGLITFARTPRRDLAMREMADVGDRDDAHAALVGIGAGDRTGMGDALRMAIQDIEGYGDPAAAQAIVLLSDGYHNEGVENPADMINEIREKGISVFTIAVGPDVDAALLENLADETGGLFYRIPPGLPEADAALELRFALTEIHDLLHDQGGIVTRVQDELETQLPKPTNDREVEFLEKVIASMQVGRTTSHVVQSPWRAFSRVIEIDLDSGAAEATFFTSYDGDPDTGELFLFSPSGELYNVAFGALPVGGRRIGSHRPYLGMRQPEAEPGQWLALVAGTTPIKFKYLTFAQHRGVALKVGPDKRHYEHGERATFLGHLYYREPLHAVDWEATLISPQGERTAVEFVLPADPVGHGCDTLRYQAVTPPLTREGYYRLEVTARSTGDTYYAYDINDGIEPPPSSEEDPRPEIPKLVRTQMLTIGVGKERVPGLKPDPRQTPVRIAPGGTGRVVIRITGAGGLGPNPHATSGDGIDVEDVIVEDGVVTVLVNVDETAEPGLYDLVITDDSGKHVLEDVILVGELGEDTRQILERCCKALVRYVRVLAWAAIALVVIGLIALIVLLVG